MRRRNDYELPVYLPAGSEFRLLINAKAVNNLGDIVGIGVAHDGEAAGLLLAPVQEEPTCGLMLGSLAIHSTCRRGTTIGHSSTKRLTFKG
jgi:hypothetical protein